MRSTLLLRLVAFSCLLPLLPPPTTLLSTFGAAEALLAAISSLRFTSSMLSSSSSSSVVVGSLIVLLEVAPLRLPSREAIREEDRLLSRRDSRFVQASRVVSSSSGIVWDRLLKDQKNLEIGRVRSERIGEGSEGFNKIHGTLEQEDSESFKSDELDLLNLTQNLVHRFSRIQMSHVFWKKKSGEPEKLTFKVQ